MKTMLCRLLIPAGVVSVLCAAAAGAVAPGTLVPFFKATDLQGQTVSLGDLVARRRVAVLFWDQRRATSARAIQVVDRLQQAYRAQGLEVVAIEGEGATAEQVLERVEKLRVIGAAQRYTVVPDPGGRIARQFRVEETPQIFILDGAGRVFYHLEDFRARDEAVLEERVKQLLGIVPPPAPSWAPDRAGGAGPVADAKADKAAGLVPPEDPNAALLEKYRYFGNYYLNRQEPGRAEEYFRKSVELAPSDADAWMHLGEAYARQRRYDQAREAWEKVLLVEPGNREAEVNIRRLVRGEY